MKDTPPVQLLHTCNSSNRQGNVLVLSPYSHSHVAKDTVDIALVMPRMASQYTHAVLTTDMALCALVAPSLRLQVCSFDSSDVSWVTSSRHHITAHHRMTHHTDR